MIQGAHGAQLEPSLGGFEEWKNIGSRGCRARVKVFIDSINEGNHNKNRGKYTISVRA